MVYHDPLCPRQVYFYLTDFSITGQGPATPQSRLIYYFGMSGYPASIYPTPSYVAGDHLILPGTSQQVDFHRAFATPWRSELKGLGQGGQVTIGVQAFGIGAARVVGFYQ